MGISPNEPDSRSNGGDNRDPGSSAEDLTGFIDGTPKQDTNFQKAQLQMTEGTN